MRFSFVPDIDSLDEIIELVNNTELPQIRAGDTHRFIDIWIVIVGGRFFLRQYYFNEQSWYAAFLQDPHGAIKCGETIIPVVGQVPPDLEQINPAINEAYLEKYAGRFPDYAHVAQKMTGPPYMARTMELVPQLGTPPTK